MKTLTEIVNEIDFPLLDKQLDVLLKIGGKLQNIPDNERDALWGIEELLSALICAYYGKGK